MKFEILLWNQDEDWQVYLGENLAWLRRLTVFG